jgi:hypothetical protein
LIGESLDTIELDFAVRVTSRRDNSFNSGGVRVTVGNTAAGAQALAHFAGRIDRDSELRGGLRSRCRGSADNLVFASEKINDLALASCESECYFVVVSI